MTATIAAAAAKVNNNSTSGQNYAIAISTVAISFDVASTMCRSFTTKDTFLEEFVGLKDALQGSTRPKDLVHRVTDESVLMLARKHLQAMRCIAQPEIATYILAEIPEQGFEKYDVMDELFGEVTAASAVVRATVS